jgi:hypothetical protein
VWIQAQDTGFITFLMHKWRLPEIHICMEVNRIYKGSCRCDTDRQTYWQNKHQPAGMQALWTFRK